MHGRRQDFCSAEAAWDRAKSLGGTGEGARQPVTIIFICPWYLGTFGEGQLGGGAPPVSPPTASAAHVYACRVHCSAKCRMTHSVCPHITSAIATAHHVFSCLWIDVGWQRGDTSAAACDQHVRQAAHGSSCHQRRLRHSLCRLLGQRL